ncbi:MAG: hypothetical protein G01um101433_248 [Parcubacteria group bacterium Gr01-1014_33]|nr:MAG: hypothetical protein G01um101433_248 [Parcubacteria group bacterium Gr01-1014_33]
MCEYIVRLSAKLIPQLRKYAYRLKDVIKELLERHPDPSSSIKNIASFAITMCIAFILLLLVYTSLFAFQWVIKKIDSKPLPPKG